MFVYIWKHNDIPFYVGASKSSRRTNPLNSGGRGWFCKNKLTEIGAKNVVVELHMVDTLEEAQVLERSLIEKYGRIQLGNGPLTNLRVGGEGLKPMTESAKLSTSLRMKKTNPMHNPETKAKAIERMRSPEVIARYSGNNNPAKRPEVKAKIRAKWQDPEFREKQRQRKLGVPIHSDESKELRRQKLLDPTNPMRKFHKVLNTDPKIKEKRVATLQTPEVKAKIVAGLKASWARRKGVIM
jgi:hypothetical protein